MLDEIKIKIEEFINPFLGELGLELVELILKRRGRTIAIEVVADKPTGGVTLAECTILNRYLSTKMEAENFMESDYVIEVCSPGIDRPLKGKKDFLRVVGREVRFYLSEPIHNKSEQVGTVQNVEETNVAIESKSQVLNIPYEKIIKAIQAI